MKMLKTFICGVPGCKHKITEMEYGEGAPLWGQLSGIVIGDDENPLLCPMHKNLIADYITQFLAVK